MRICLKSNRRGSAVLAVIAILAMMSILLIANARAIWQLNREVRLVEKRQLHRWAGTSGQAAPPVNPGTSGAH